jgi:hypothetical protein
MLDDRGDSRGASETTSQYSVIVNSMRRFVEKNPLLVTLAGLCICLAASMSVSRSAIRVRQPTTSVNVPYEWRIELGGQSTSRDVELQFAYSVSNRFGDGNVRYVKYGEREYGINLVWTPSQFEGNFRFARPSGSAGPLKYGERVAISVDKGGYLKYGDREYGINLVWSSAPVYEWEIRGEAANGQWPGATIRTERVVALYNTTRADYLAHCEREYGIDLRWASDCKHLQIAATVQTDISLKLLGNSANPQCSGRTHIIWTFRAVSTSGSPGLTPQFVTRDLSYRTPGCYLKEEFPLAEGTWDINVQTPGWSTTCRRKLMAPRQRVDLVEGQPGCLDVKVREH